MSADGSMNSRMGVEESVRAATVVFIDRLIFIAES
jgi:hypothetical protein